MLARFTLRRRARHALPAAIAARLRTHLTFANITATIALFIALAGRRWAPTRWETWWSAAT
jgi:hypothetical protein